jgi:hypothetical protein
MYMPGLSRKRLPKIAWTRGYSIFRLLADFGVHDMGPFACASSPFRKQNRLDIDVVAGLWFEELAKTWAECLKTGCIFFQGETEGRFTDEVAGLCALASSDLRNSVRKRVEEVLRNHVRVVQRPFSAMVDWDTCDRSFQLMLWISGFLWAWMEHLPRPSQIESILREAEVGLKRRSELDWRRSSAEELLRYRTSHL